MRIYFDLEFSDLKHKAKLISAGFIADTGEVLYLEIESAYWQEEASPFVQESVVPLLSETGMSANEATNRIVTWIDAHGQDIHLISDSDWDLRILRKHLARSQRHWPRNWLWTQAPQHLASELHLRYDDVVATWFLASHRPQHHALNDAEAIACATWKAQGLETTVLR